MLSVADALHQILQQVKPLASEFLTGNASLVGKVLAENYSSDLDSPPFTKSMMDGFAVRAEDCQQPNVNLSVIEEIPAGYFPQITLGPQQASRIMTGAPVPTGADSVVPKEQCQDSQTSVTVTNTVKRGQFVISRGAEMKAGEIVLKKGTLLQPQHLGLLAAIGQTSVQIYRTPQVGVLPTGNELVDAPIIPEQGQIRNTNGPMLLAQIFRAGASAVPYPILKDSPENLSRGIQQALETNDVVILSGGVSVGKYDHLPEVLKQIGCTIHFHKIQMKPGRPLLFATRRERIIFGLPGNPVSSFVCFELFVRPALRVMKGDTVTGHEFVPIPLAKDFETDNNRPTYGPAQVTFTVDGPRVTAQSWFGSADLRGLGNCNALIEVEAGRVSKKSGEFLRCLLL